MGETAKTLWIKKKKYIYPMFAWGKSGKASWRNPSLIYTPKMGRWQSMEMTERPAKQKETAWSKQEEGRCVWMGILNSLFD